MTGALLLLLPWATTRGISFVDALFTSTSAVCVTGLIVVDTAKDFTFFGQIIILLLIQFGGLGIMTFSIAILTLLGGEFSIKWRFTFESFYSDIQKLPVKSILKRILVYTIYSEVIAAAFLFTQFKRDYSFGKALWYSVFHAVSAFCNAGFSTFSDSLVHYKSNTVVILTTGTSIVLGGLGFIVLTELFNVKLTSSRHFFRQFSLHSRLVLVTTIILIVTGGVMFLILEWGFVLHGFSLKDKLLNAFFHSISCRTAGFNTINVGSLRESTLFLSIALMFIGGSPGSIAGGIKTTTFAAIAGLLYSKFKGHNQVIFWGRALDSDTLDRSTTLIILAGLFIGISTFFLLAINSLISTIALSPVFLR